MCAKRIRKLWLEILWKVPPGVSPETVRDTLRRSIQNGTYAYPKEWRVVIKWRNKQNAPMKAGPFTGEMQRSKQSSPGFDSVVLTYLERQ